MFSKNSANKRGRKRHLSGDTFVDEVIQQVDQSLSAERTLSDAFRHVSSAEMSTESIRQLPHSLISLYLSVKFDQPVVNFVTSSLAGLAVLPCSLRLKSLSQWTGLSVHEASLLYEACTVFQKATPCILQNTVHLNASLQFPVVLTPPTAVCFKCGNNLTEHNKCCNVSVYSLVGKVEGVKFSLRCSSCKLNYNYDRYGDTSRGWQLYQEQRPLVEASDVCFVERRLLDWQCALANHSWVSFSGFSTAYNEVFQLLSGVGEYGEKQCASAFWNGELECELRELQRLDFFGLFKRNEDREKVMHEVDNIRANGVYTHSSDDCSDACIERGCGKLWVVDGQWKLMFAHCMMERKNFIRGMPLVNYPNVCTNSPQHGKAFCTEHVQYLNDKHPEVPTDIHEFLKHCGINHDNNAGDDTTSEYLDKDVTKVDKVISLLGNEAPDLTIGNSALDAQGNTGFIEKEHGPMTAVLQNCLEPQPTTCNKETGGKQRLQKWSRGHLFIVRGGGIIDKWSPLFKSESPSQVFIIVLSWLFTILQKMNPLNWGNVFLAYDNMCHLDGLKAARNLLPWPSPWDKAWHSIKKIIDSLHIRNHKDKSCQEKYNPASLKEELPGGNTMAAEQTFVWLSRFKKILCAMPKVHHLFYLHRIVKRRNKYTVICYKNGKKPLLPKARSTSKTKQN